MGRTEVACKLDNASLAKQLHAGVPETAVLPKVDRNTQDDLCVVKVRTGQPLAARAAAAAAMLRPRISYVPYLRVRAKRSIKNVIAWDAALDLYERVVEVIGARSSGADMAVGMTTVYRARNRQAGVKDRAYFARILVK